MRTTTKAVAFLNYEEDVDDGTILCMAEELQSLQATQNSQTIIALYDDPLQAYQNRQHAYAHNCICVAFSLEVAARLSLLHPHVHCAASLTDLLEAIPALVEQKRVPPAKPEQKTPCAAMNIVFVVNNFMVGGLEQVIIDIAKLAKKNGHRPMICYEGIIDPITQLDVEEANIEHCKLPEGFDARKAFLQSENISIVNAHYATILAREAHELNIPFLQTIHNMYLWLGEQDIAHWQEVDAYTSAYIAVSANAAMVADVKIGLPVDKITIIPNGVDIIPHDFTCAPEQDTELRNEFAIPNDGIIFVQVATMNPVKGHITSIEAMRELLQERDDIYLILLGKHGDVALTEKLQTKIADYGLTKHVFMPGHRKDVHRFLNVARAMVAPSFIEGWSLAISEAMQLGVFVIATDVGGACEQFRGTDNILIPSYYDSVENLSNEAYFSLLLDEDCMKKHAKNLSKAMLNMADRGQRTVNTAKSGTHRTPEEAYSTHLELMGNLVHTINGTDTNSPL